MLEARPLVDGFGRSHNYLRLSVTDRCNFRCTYCMPPEGLEWTPRSEILSFEEIERLVRIFCQMGIRKVRLTGGEPTARAGLTQLVQRLANIPQLSQLTMTTNGHTLDRLAAPLVRAGLQRINISIDSLDPECFSRLTGGARIEPVLRGIHAARMSGLDPIRLNAVILRGQNDGEIMDLVHFVERHPQSLEIRFIEYMPFQVRAHQCVPGSEILDIIRQHRELEPRASGDGAPGPASLWFCPQTGLRLGLIVPLSNKFCSSCNRLRLQATGHLRTCLAHEKTPSLRDLLRRGSTNEELERAIRLMVLGKPEGHDCTVEGGQVFEGAMTGVGG